MAGVRETRSSSPAPPPPRSTASSIRSCPTTRKRGCSRRTSRKSATFSTRRISTRPARSCGRRANASRPAARRCPGSRIRTNDSTRGCSRASPTGCWRAKASFPEISPSGAQRSGAVKRRRSISDGSRSSRRALGELELGGKLKRVEHHVTHAANAYYNSGFDEALIVTLDGYGSGLSGSVNLGRGGRIERLHSQEYPHSLGTFYESVTSALGFKPSRHEGKIVGLAAYGDPSVLGDVLRRRFVESNGGFRIVETNNVYFAQAAGQPVPEDRRRRRLPARARAGRRGVCLAVRPEDRGTQSRVVRRRGRQREAESAPARDRGHRRDLHPPEHGRRRLRHRGRAPGVPGQSGAQPPAERRLPGARSSRAIRSPRPFAPRSCRLRNTGRSNRRSRRCLPPARSSRASTAAWSTARARSGTARSSTTPRSRR